MTHFTVVPLGDHVVTVKYNFDPGERRAMYTRGGEGHPGSPPSVLVTDVFIGSLHFPSEVFEKAVVEGWELKILEGIEAEGERE